MTQPSQGRVRFGAFELDLKSGELYPIEKGQSDGKVLLREQSFQVLRMLVERAGEIVTRDEIKQRLWPNDTIVDFDHSINTVIKTLRRTLGDNAEDPRYIETLARRGYRLRVTAEWLPTVVENVAEPASAPGPQPASGRVQRQRKPWWWRVAPVVASAAILVAGYMSWRHFRNATPPGSQKVMLAVLPFQNLTGDPNKEYLADGLTEQTISQLGRLNPEQLGVIARTSVMGYKHKDERLDQIGRELSVQYVLENSLRESGIHLRLTAQLIQVKDQTHLWSQDYDYAAKDTLNVEDEVAKAVAREIRLRLTPQKQAELAQTHPVNPEAFDAYLQGYHFFQGRTDKDADMAAKYFERATQLDPSYALAWAWLSRARNWQANEGLIPMEEGRRLAREAVERALALDPNLAEAHAQMGRIKEQVDYDWAGGNASLQRAVALEPGNPEYLRLTAILAACFGRFDEALQLARRAIDLDPLNAGSWEALAEIELYVGQLDQSAADSKKAHEVNPDYWDSPILLSRIYLLQGRPQDALREIEHVHNATYRAHLYALTYYALGREKESDAALSELITKYYASNAFEIATIYAFRNQTNEAFEWLDRAYAQRDPSLMATRMEPLLNSLHNDPRYTALLKKLNLPN
ncbi:MAG TPA: winged helix-turn-helix domain-containing protein [Candidatus Acidoferrum sp.]|nr:winged helix-turn-helix domain-containing protein [Candidatus Acidoferrum sp.]